jgi:hypothetical protein
MIPLNAVGRYLAELHAALDRAGWKATALLLPGLVLFPLLTQSLLHPLDVVKLDYVLHGFPKPHSAAARQLTVALAEVAVIFGATVLWQLVVTVSFYRRAQVFGRKAATPQLYPVALLLVGGIGNLGWFIGLSAASSDVGGYVIGLTSTALTIALEMFCERLGRDFVVGPPAGFHPPA